MKCVCLLVLFIAVGHKADVQKFTAELSERTFCCFNEDAI